MLSYRRSACAGWTQSRAEPEDSPKRRLDGIQRQEGGAARIVILSPVGRDAGSGGGFVLYHDVLQRAAQCRFNGDFPPRLDAQDRRHRPDDAADGVHRRPA